MRERRVHTLRRVGGNVKRHDFQGKFLCLEGKSCSKGSWHASLGED
jgi:hypothetical protein